MRNVSFSPSGSPAAPLTTTTGLPPASRTACTFASTGKPAPPRPRSPLSAMSRPAPALRSGPYVARCSPSAHRPAVRAHSGQQPRHPGPAEELGVAGGSATAGTDRRSHIPVGHSPVISPVGAPAGDRWPGTSSRIHSPVADWSGQFGRR